MTRWFLIALLAGAVALILLLTQVSSKETRVRGEGAYDTDGDLWSDGYEQYIGTSPLTACLRPDVDPAVHGWPPDVTNDGRVDVSDLVQFTQLWESEVSPLQPMLRRYDISGEPMGSGFIDVSDLVIVTGRFGTSC